MAKAFTYYNNMMQTTEHVVMQPHVRNTSIHLLGQNNRVLRSASDFISSTKKRLLVGIPNFIPCVLSATGHRNTIDITSLLKWTLHHLKQPTNCNTLVILIWRHASYSLYFLVTITGYDDI